MATISLSPSSVAAGLPCERCAWQRQTLQHGGCLRQPGSRAGCVQTRARAQIPPRHPEWWAEGWDFTDHGALVAGKQQLLGRGLKVLLGHGPEPQHGEPTGASRTSPRPWGWLSGRAPSTSGSSHTVHLPKGHRQWCDEAWSRGFGLSHPRVGGELRAAVGGTPKRTTQTQMKALSYIRCYIRHHHGEKAGDPAGGEKRAQKVHIDMIETTLKHLKSLPTAPWRGQNNSKRSSPKTPGAPLLSGALERPQQPPFIVKAKKP